MDGKDIGQSEAIKLCQNSNKASGIVRRDSHLLSLIHNDVLNAQDFTTNFGAHSTCSRTVDILRDMQISAFLGSISLSS